MHIKNNVLKSVLLKSILILSVFLLFISIGCLSKDLADPLTKEERAWLTEHDGEIRLAHDPNAKPIDYIDQDGHFQGLAADYVRLIEKRLNFKFDILRIKTWDEVLKKSRTKDIDVLCAFSKSQEREQFMLFTEPYVTIPVVILTRDDFKGNLSLDVMKNLKVTFNDGWVVDDYLRQNYNHLNMMPAVNSDEALDNLITNKADAWVTALTVASIKIEENSVANVRIAGETDLSFHLAFASRKDWPVLNSILKKGLALISEDERADIFNKRIHIHQQSIFESRNFWITVFVILGLSVLFGIVIFSWNRTLKKKVDEKTKALESELFERKQAQDALQESESLFLQMFEQSTTSMGLYNIDGAIKRVNNEFCKMFGIEEKVIKDSGYNVFKDKAVIEVGLIPLLNNLFYEKKTEKWEINFDIDLASTSTRTPTSRTGKVFLEVFGYPVLNLKGDLEYVVLQHYDISERKQAEEELRKREYQYNAIVENSGDYIMRYDRAHRHIWANQRAIKSTGLPPEKFLDKTHREMNFPEHLCELWENNIDEVFTTGEVQRVEFDIKLENGFMTLDLQFSPEFNEEGNVLSVIGVSRDITERKQAEEIKKSLLAISNAVNTTQNLNDLYHFIYNSLGNIMDVTNFFIAMLDINKNTLFFPYHVDTTDDDFFPISNFDTNDSLTGLVVSQRKPILLKKNDLEKLSAQNGVWGPVPLIWMGAPLIVRDEVIGVIAVQSYLDSTLYKEQDIQVLSGISDQIAIAIDRKRTEMTLLESEKKYRHLFQNAPAGIYEIDFEKAKFINVNEVMCSYTGYSEEEFLTMNPMDLLTEDSKNLFIKRFEKISAGENLENSFEYDIIKKDGQEVCVILNNDYIYENGKLIGSRVVVHDITELKQAQEEKIKAQKITGEQKKLALVGQVAGKMAHDFNNILGIIMGNAELSLMDCKEEETKRTLELIFDQTLRGKNLTRNLIAFAKDQEPKQEFFRISEKIDLVVNLLKKDLQGIELIKEDKQGVPDLLADPGMIEHALINLIQNSIHATSMSEHPRIILRTYCPDENICFEIEDNGCGINKEDLGNIYEPSFTLKGTNDLTGSYGRGIKGTGYGMANVKKYIEQHKGSISVKSEFGSGTKFTISLPVIKKELTSEEKVEIQKEKICFDKSILLVEDEIAISGVQYRILSQEPCNHKVDIANDGQVAMDLFKRNKYDLISLDYILPGKINGMDVYNHIRVTNKTIPILFISGNIEFLESIKELKQRDTNIAHLSKPCQNKNYVNSINNLLERTSSAKE